MAVESSSMIVAYELRINGSPESIVTTSLEEAVGIVSRALKAEPKSLPILVKIRRAQMPRKAYDALPDIKEGETGG